MKDFCLVATSLWNSTISRWRTPLHLKILLYDLDEGLLVPLLLLNGELLTLGISSKLQLNLVQPHVNLGESEIWNNIFENIFINYIPGDSSFGSRWTFACSQIRVHEVWRNSLCKIMECTGYRIYIIERNYFETNFSCLFLYLPYIHYLSLSLFISLMRTSGFGVGEGIG